MIKKNKLNKKFFLLSLSILLVLIIIFTMLVIILFTDKFGKPHYMFTSFVTKTKIINVDTYDEPYLSVAINNKFSSYNINSYLCYLNLVNLKYCDNLKDLMIGSSRDSYYNDVNFINNTNITELTLIGVYSNDWTAISRLTKLEDVVFSEVNISDMAVFNNMDNLVSISILNTLPISFINTDLNKSLKYLELGSYIYGEATTDISSISNYMSLEELNIRYTDIEDISELTKLEHLEDLYLEDNDLISDYDPLYDIPNLKKLSIEKNTLSDELTELLLKKGVEINYI